jgi:hypothetical protein
MKKQILLLLSFLFCLTACSNKELDEPDLSDPLEKYMWYGRLHNSFLDSADERFSPETKSRTDDSIESDSLTLEELKEFQLEQARNCGLPSEEAEILVTALEEKESYYVAENLWNDIFPNNSMSSMLVRLRQLQTAKYIDNTERTILRDLLTAIHQNKNDQISNYDFALKVNELSHVWSNYSRLNGEDWGVMTGVILAISKSSAEWWDNYLYDSRSASAIISLDVGGAITGAVLNAAIQYYQNKRVNMKTVGLHALAGAITGSTGIAGKVGRWVTSIGKLFKLKDRNKNYTANEMYNMKGVKLNYISTCDE